MGFLHFFWPEAKVQEKIRSGERRSFGPLQSSLVFLDRLHSNSEYPRLGIHNGPSRFRWTGVKPSRSFHHDPPRRSILDLEISNGLRLFGSFMPPSRVQPHPKNCHCHHLTIFNHHSLSDFSHHPPELARPLIRIEEYGI